MRKLNFLLSLILFTSSYSFSENWQDKWAESLLLSHENDFVESKKALDAAIELSEEENPMHSFLYVDRARLSMLLGENHEALKDIKKALSKPLETQERVRALVTKIFVSARLQKMDSFFEDLASLQPLVDLPFVEAKDSQLIMKNIPKSEVYKKMMSCYLIHSGLCYDAGDILFLKSNRMSAEKINHCGCQKCIAEYAKTRECDSCRAIVSPTKQNISIEGLMQEAIQYAAKMKLQLEDQVAVLVGLLQIQQTNLGIEVFDDTFEKIFQDIDQSSELYWD